MNQREKLKLLHGPYAAPNLKRGDKATCLLRDCDVVVTGMSAGRIPWPRCRAVVRRGGSGLLLAGNLVRAVQCESALAIRYCWGASALAVWHWRQALGVDRLGTEGSRLLRELLNEEIGAGLQGQTLPAPRESSG